MVPIEIYLKFQGLNYFLEGRFLPILLKIQNTLLIFFIALASLQIFQVLYCVVQYFNAVWVELGYESLHHRAISILKQARVNYLVGFENLDVAVQRRNYLQSLLRVEYFDILVPIAVYTFDNMSVELPDNEFQQRFFEWPKSVETF